MYFSINEIPDDLGLGFLYLTEIDSNDVNPDIKIEGLIKLGKTDNNIKYRLKSYKSKVFNIQVFKCNEPSIREKLIKGYIRYKEKISSIFGSEYFSIKTKDKICTIINKILSIDDDVINEIKKLSLKIDYTLFDKEIELIKLKKHKGQIQKVNISSLKCHYCNHNFSSKKTLNEHIQTSKKCINSRDLSKSFICMWCEVEFLSKEDLHIHYNRCKANKEIVHVSLLEKYEFLKEENSRLKEENKRLIEKTEKLINDFISVK